MRRMAGVILVFFSFASYAATCTVSSGGLAFGSYDPIQSSDGLSSTTPITIVCTGLSITGGSVPYTVALSTGSGHFSSRTMGNGANSLNYNIYTSAVYDHIWGDGTNGTVTSGGTCSGISTTCSSSLTAYGLVPSQPQAKPATYTDSLTMTVTY